MRSLSSSWTQLSNRRNLSQFNVCWCSGESSGINTWSVELGLCLTTSLCWIQIIFIFSTTKKIEIGADEVVASPLAKTICGAYLIQLLCHSFSILSHSDVAKYRWTKFLMMIFKFDTNFHPRMESYC